MRAGEEFMTKAKVLLADASVFSLELLKDFLKQSQVQIFTAASGPEAISQARKLRPDLVVLDYGLPESNGLDCCQAIKAEQQLCDVPMILLVPSGHAAEERAGLAAGCAAVLTKPLNRRAFLEVGRNLLGRIERREPRILCRATIACRFEQETIFGTIEDISPHGMFVGSSHQAKPGEALRIKFLLPWQEGRFIDTEARVTWAQGARSQIKNKLPQGFGITFQGLVAAEEGAIRDFIDHSLLRHQHLDD
jgi:CheY-like chemotaxis protein